MYVLKIPEHVEALLSDLEQVYPRAAKNIRLFWSPDKDCDEFFRNMLSHTSGKNSAGFSHEALRLVFQIYEEYQKILSEFQTINKSNDEIKLMNDVKNNVWNKPSFKS